MHTIDRKPDEGGPTCRLGCYRICDKNDGTTVGLDVNRPHATIVADKRGSGESHTLNVVAERLTRTAGVAPAVVNLMGVFCGLAESSIDVTVHNPSRIRAGVPPPSVRPELLGFGPTTPAELPIWRLAAGEDSLMTMYGTADDDGAIPETRRAAANHLALADS